MKNPTQEHRAGVQHGRRSHLVTGSEPPKTPIDQSYVGARAGSNVRTDPGNHSQSQVHVNGRLRKGHTISWPKWEKGGYHGLWH